MLIIRLLTLMIFIFVLSACQSSVPVPTNEVERNEIEEAEIREMMSRQQDRQLPNFITPDEINVHATPDDCWMQIETRVYDFSPLFSVATPSAQILELCGTDASEAFREGLFGVDLAEFYVGDLVLEQ